ncbi:MAG: NAD(P)-dependent oxidoreductase [Desulfobacteraceae bacterium]|jgi:hydroxypyruvate reductase 1|nr:NAD(P)-dependent oxidoreductase [Desulfobacteraceae bacterium]
MERHAWQVYNPDGRFRIVVTKPLPGRRWRDILTTAGCRIEVCQDRTVLSTGEIAAAIGEHCDAAIGQLTERWGEGLFQALTGAGGQAYSNYAVGYNNVDLEAATRLGIPVGNTPGVLTETTAEMTVALTFAAARRIGEAERYLRAGRYTGWLPDLFLGTLLHGKTLGIVGAGRIGAAYARMMVQGHGMHVIYHDLVPNSDLESVVADISRFRVAHGQAPVTCRRAESVEVLLASADCVSIHTVLDDSTHHLIDARRLAMMKPDAILINTSRGPVIDEAALVAHCRENPQFRAGLDVFEHEPAMAPGLAELDNVVIVPHIASATGWTREGMAVLAACNVAGLIRGFPLWQGETVLAFLDDPPPQAVPSVVNARELGLTPGDDR